MAASQVPRFEQLLTEGGISAGQSAASQVLRFEQLLTYHTEHC